MHESLPFTKYQKTALNNKITQNNTAEKIRHSFLCKKNESYEEIITADGGNIIVHQHFESR